MKNSFILQLILVAGMMCVPGCKRENRELKNEAKIMAEAMCKGIGIMNTLKQVNPADTIRVARLQGEYQAVQTEMARINQAFMTKYGEKTASAEFTEEFRKYLNESMLGCRNLSKEDRETFEKQVK
jgi:hypothetical protein